MDSASTSGERAFAQTRLGDLAWSQGISTGRRSNTGTPWTPRRSIRTRRRGRLGCSRRG
ncbi:hypothetical protein NKH18_24310 [Streptomyces sp. M10(2022)]